jgi:hypothetical protein
MKVTATVEELRLLRRLSHVIRQQVRYCQLHDKPADVEKVYQLVCDTASILVGQVVGPMGHQQLRIKIQHALKRTEINQSASAARQAEGIEREPDQAELDFANMEQFRGIPPSIAYEEPEGSGHIVYVPYIDAVKAQRDGAASLHHKGITFDVKAEELLLASNRFCDSLIPLYGDLPVRELIRLWREDHEEEVGNGAE